MFLVKWILVLVMSFFIYGCSMFSASTDLKLNMRLAPDTNSNKVLSIIIVPMNKATFLKTSYKEALNYVGKNGTNFISLTPDDFKEGSYSFETDISAQTGMGIFVFFTNMSPESQWKQYIDNAQGRDYTFYLTKNSLNFSDED